MRALPLIAVTAVVLAAGVVPATVAPSSTTPRASLDRVGVWQAPTNATGPNDAAAVRSAIEDGTLTRATGVGDNSTLVIGVELHGFSAAVSNATGSNATERFLSAMAEHGDLTVAQTNPPPSLRPLYVHLLDGRGVEVYPDTTDDTYYVVVDLDEARVTRGEDGSETRLERGTYQFIVSAELTADSPLTEERQRAVAPVEPRWATVETAPDGRVHVRSQSNLTIAGTTNVGTGWPVTVVVSGDDDPDTATDESFRLTRNATVGPSGEHEHFHERTFDATFDRGTLPTAGRNVTVDVQLDGRSLLGEPVPVELADPRAAVAIDAVDDDSRVSDVTLTVNASLSTGGFLVLHEGSARGPVVGHTQYLDSGDHVASVYTSEPTDADELVVVAHRDANHNEWFDGPSVDRAYAEGDPHDGTVLSWTESTTPSETTTPSATDGATSSPTDGATSSSPSSASTDRTRSSTTTPSFGTPVTVFALVVAVALVALYRH